MQITYVVDTSVNEDRSYLEFWYKDVIYKISQYIYLYKVQSYDFKSWEQENTAMNCPRVIKPIKG